MSVVTEPHQSPDPGLICMWADTQLSRHIGGWINIKNTLTNDLEMTKSLSLQSLPTFSISTIRIQVFTLTKPNMNKWQNKSLHMKPGSENRLPVVPTMHCVIMLAPSDSFIHLTSDQCESHSWTLPVHTSTKYHENTSAGQEPGFYFDRAESEMKFQHSTVSTMKWSEPALHKQNSKQIKWWMGESGSVNLTFYTDNRKEEESSSQTILYKTIHIY